MTVNIHPKFVHQFQHCFSNHLRRVDFLVIVEEMRAPKYMGNLELMLMLTLVRLDGDGYGVSISREIKDTAGYEIALGTIYAVLERLERSGMVSTSLGEPTPERGGRAKRYFRVTAKGLREVSRARRALTRLSRGLPQVVGGRA